jgi:hypothetical protein
VSSSLFGPLLMMGRCSLCLVHVFLCLYPCDWLFALPSMVVALSIDFSPDMGSQSTERRSVSALPFCRQITVMAAPHNASLMSDHHQRTRALLRISAKVSLKGCRSCGCFSTCHSPPWWGHLFLWWMCRTPLAISRALPSTSWTPLPTHNTQAFPGPLELT